MKTSTLYRMASMRPAGSQKTSKLLISFYYNFLCVVGFAFGFGFGFFLFFFFFLPPGVSPTFSHSLLAILDQNSLTAIR